MSGPISYCFGSFVVRVILAFQLLFTTCCSEVFKFEYSISTVLLIMVKNMVEYGGTDNASVLIWESVDTVFSDYVANEKL